VAGVATGSVYGLIALGFLIINHATGVVNFAQGVMLMVGAVSTYLLVVVLGLSYWVAIPLVIIIGVLLALVFDQTLVTPLQKRNAPVFSIVIGTLLFGSVIAELAAQIAGDQPHGVPAIVDNSPITIGELTIRPQTVISLIAAWVIVLGVWYFFNKTLTGLSVRALGINRTGAAVVGVRVKRMVRIAMILSIVVTVIGGLLIAPILGAGPRMGIDLGVKGFAAAVLGGFNSVYLAMAAGVALGVLEVLTAFYVSSAYSSAVAYALLLLALCLQPIRGSRLLQKFKVARA